MRKDANRTGHASAEAFSWRVGRIRRLTGWSVAEFARMLCVGPELVAAWESGATDPGPERRERVMGAIASVDPQALAAALPPSRTLH